jgi:hypothetical protein
MRAARAVTLGLAIASAPVAGCGQSHTGDPDGGSSRDSGPLVDARTTGDAGDPVDASATDAGSVDSGTAIDSGIADAGLVCPPVFPPTTQQCCDAEGGEWIDGMCIVAVPGPFVPPSMDA